MRAVRVQFHRKSQPADLCDEFRQIAVQAGLAARDRHAVKEPLPLCQKSEQLILFHHRRRLSRRQLVIVAVRAAQVAPAQKNRAGHMTGKVKQRHLLKSVYFHKTLQSRAP